MLIGTAPRQPEKRPPRTCKAVHKFSPCARPFAFGVSLREPPDDHRDAGEGELAEHDRDAIEIGRMLWAEPDERCGPTPSADWVILSRFDHAESTRQDWVLHQMRRFMARTFAQSHRHCQMGLPRPSFEVVRRPLCDGMKMPGGWGLLFLTFLTFHTFLMM